MDSGILSRVLDDIREYGGDFVIEEFDVGHEAHDPSSARITVEAPDDDSLQRLLMRLQTRGVNQLAHGDAAVATSEQDGVLPDGFYATTNLETQVRLGGRWYDVDHPEMDCGLVVEESAAGDPRVRTVPMSDVTRGMRIVVGAAGIQVSVPSSDPLGRGDQPRSARTTDRSARRRCWCARWPTGCGRHGPRASGCCGWPAPASSTRAAYRPWWRSCGPAGSTSSSPATRWPRSTSRPRSTVPATTAAPRPVTSTVTSTGSGRSTPSARPARSTARCATACSRAA